ncbi:MAG: hypothetical protein ACQESN_08810 [Thermotogota bacterium]
MEKYDDNNICVKIGKMEEKLDNIDKSVCDVKDEIKKQNDNLSKEFKSMNSRLNQKADKDFVYKIVSGAIALLAVLIALLQYISPI